MPKITLNDLRQMILDETVSDEEIAQYLMEDTDAPPAFSPRVSINPEMVDDQGLEADVAMAAFNSWSRRRRQRKYRRKIAGGWTGLKIVSEGDSWFQYPFLLKDTIDHLFDDYAIFSLGAAGDLVSAMLAQDEMHDAIRAENPHVFLLSGGGNDLLGDGRLATAVHPFDPAREAEDYPNQNFAARLNEVLGIMRQIFGSLTAEFPSLKILCHGYDYAIPDRGKWLGRPMAQLGIEDSGLQAAIVRVMIDRFNAGLVDLSDEFPGRVHRVNCTNAVGADEWHDELHPDRDGFGKVADRYRDLINHLFSGRESLRKPAEPLSPGREAMIATAKDLGASEFRALVDHRGRELLSKPLAPTAKEGTRREIEREISDHFEKISGGADFLPAHFLSRGDTRARAVCKINLPGGSGSGFLIGERGFIMTNNHVIASIDEARDAMAEFDFEEGSSSLTVTLEPDRFFVTSVELDFTIVGCDPSAVSEIEPIALLRSPATITRNERVNIVQHPRGRQKEVALHDNKVKRVKDKVVWYTTDTEPGSSGSPVFNNEWGLVALHHAGWFEADGTTTNEGVRMAAIVSHLIALSAANESSSNGLRDLLATIPDTSPHLGFFDIMGITGAGVHEVEIPEYRGSQEFADVGFWNIEHFNDRISDARVDQVAEVLAHLSLDAIGLVEVQRDAMERVTAALQRLGYSYDFKYLNVRGSQDLAVLFDSSTTEVTIAQDLLNRHRDAWNARTASGHSAFPRRPMIARVKIEHKVATTATSDNATVEFIMIAVHLKAFGDPQSRSRRRLASNILAEVIEDIRTSENLPVVLGGDMNETLNTDVLNALTEAPDLIALTSDDADDNALSYVGPRHRSLIDHIVVSDDVKLAEISGDDAAIVRLDKSVSDFVSDISDHVPLVIRMISRDSPLQFN
ncbi:trypsin-like peptidase domain-containing protein [Ruegeria sp. 2205SS24-7]|uniref:trypsin-like peptidase domain-containing protein n=1 Tax=Ruegeria discodermiae TaxID=3064389 RepID=UPI002741075B|nr:trypsin-like peptidase domain-containing protein [Ruegeria sp. 2205SS24-7]MDP5220457.1 trypsin-like peptidase domain-containing protein [Ruegeria sp. 2205SS24-7]